MPVYILATVYTSMIGIKEQVSKTRHCLSFKLDFGHIRCSQMDLSKCSDKHGDTVYE